MFVLELNARDLHTGLGRLLDQARVAGLTLTAVDARAEGRDYRIRAVIDAADREIVERLARGVGRIVGVAAIAVSHEPCRAAS